MQSVPEIFRSLADPTRLRIVTLLRAMELSVGELAQVLGQSQPRVLPPCEDPDRCGLAERRKEGSWVFLSLGNARRVEPLFTLLDRWTESEGEDPWRSPTQRASRPSARIGPLRPSAILRRTPRIGRA
jgi:ArsR family transcriptional regulator